MKNEVNGNYAVKNTEVNLTGDVKEVLKTLVLLERGFGVGYLVQLLKGDKEKQPRQPGHEAFETFGSLERYTEERIKNIIHMAADHGLIEPENPKASTVSITDAGRKFLESPFEIMVKWSKLNLTSFDYQLRWALRKSRRESARNANLPAYMVYSDYAIERIIRNRPRTLAELKKVPGMTPFIAETYGEKILAAVAENNQLILEDSIAKARKEVKAPTFQSTKKLFLEGKSIQEISSIKGVSERTVKGYLEKLHLCGEINLKPWIEKNLDSKVLYKGAEYFRKVESPRMKEAYETLGLDYDTLRFCKLYVSDVSSSYEELAIPA